ncbi:hypothetical protein MMC32_006462 [Xylographa parallela]|nr:hypothetical protein [Xylographa parallela]
MDPPQPSDANPQAARQCLAALYILRVLRPRPRSASPSKSWSPRLPTISQQRIQQATSDALPTTPPTPPPKPAPLPPPDKELTVLYLAYGSNLCAATFQGRRGIRPLAATNVVVPALRMTFDLPGLPYAEPCFANTAYRDLDPPVPTTPSRGTPPPHEHKHHRHRHPQPQPTWPHGLVGVVYEVTPTDYAHIIATEGGGAGYQDILVACHALAPHSPSVPSVPDTPPFHAHTLFAPIPPPPPHTPLRSGGLPRPSPSLAQPSPRYLALIRTGAAEHGLPPDYAAYLGALRAYVPTSPAQRLGRFVFLAVWLPWVVWLLGLARVYGGEGGRSPGWVLWLTGRVFDGMWRCYDGVFKGVFGEGEWTVEGEGGGGGDGDGEGGWWPGEGDEWGEKGALLEGGGKGDVV